jgi:hypothetical protein
MGFSGQWHAPSQPKGHWWEVARGGPWWWSRHAQSRGRVWRESIAPSAWIGVEKTAARPVCPLVVADAGADALF